MEVGLVRRPVGMEGHGVRVEPYRPPEVCQQPVKVIDGFDLRLVGPKQVNRARSKERLDIMIHVPERRPDFIRDQLLSAEPRERCA